ncbi:MotA/TolQ/ExbB proton channel family protein [Candidatus Dependentiae bacterium]|nr:MotA/TolQ/ExbB proton channel family protein [Candidatus Dependentiae bacterium]
MSAISMQNALMQLILASDYVSKFVLIVLFLMSIASWAIAFYKLLSLKKKKREITNAETILNRVISFEDLARESANLNNSMPGKILSYYLQSLKSVLQLGNGLSEKDFEYLQITIDQHIADVIHTEESYLNFLSTSAAVSPLLGLFGTIWGLIHSFVSISALKSADIATVAPGIAEALITTLAGLIVAIPSLILFHYINSQIRDLEHRLLMFISKIEMIVRYNLRGQNQ